MAIAEQRPITDPARFVAPTRDTGIDLIRALCVLGVVVLHSLMVGVTVTDTGPAFRNASEGSNWITPLSWVFQMMPLFFVVGGFAGYTSFTRARERGGTAAQFTAGRIHRLLLPAVSVIAVAGASLILLTLAGVSADLVTIAGYRFGQPLWFLAVFLLCQALLPVLLIAHQRHAWCTISLLALGAVTVDIVRIATGAETLGILNLALVWLALQQVGFFLADGRISALGHRTRKIIALAAVLGLLIGVACGIYSPDLIDNINPPTTALLFVGVAHTMVVSLLRERLRAWSEHPLGARLRGFITPRAMTIYLWHMPVLLLMAGSSAVLASATGFTLPEPNSFGWWLTRPLWLAVTLLLTAAAARRLARIEAQPAPRATQSPVRLVLATTIGIAGVAALLVLGTTPVTAAAVVMLLVVALRLARAPRSTERPLSPAQRRAPTGVQGAVQ